MKKKVFFIVSICSILTFGLTGCMGKNSLLNSSEKDFVKQEIVNAPVQCLYGCPVSKKNRKRRWLS